MPNVDLASETVDLTDADALMKIVHLQLPELPIDVLGNRCLEPDEGRYAYVKLATATERFLRRGVRYVGALSEDPAMRAMVREPRPLLEVLGDGSGANPGRYGLGLP